MFIRTPPNFRRLGKNVRGRVKTAFWPFLRLLLEKMQVPDAEAVEDGAFRGAEIPAEKRGRKRPIPDRAGAFQSGRPQAGVCCLQKAGQV